MKKRKLSAIKRELESVFSEYIRRRDVNSNGFVHCVTCGKYDYWPGMHAGHFFKRQHLGTRYDERNVHPQCVSCNTYRGGREAQHAVYILGRYGKAVFDELEALHRTPVKLYYSDYLELLNRYKGLLAGLDGMREAA